MRVSFGITFAIDDWRRGRLLIRDLDPEIPEEITARGAGCLGTFIGACFMAMKGSAKLCALVGEPDKTKLTN